MQITSSWFARRAHSYGFVGADSFWSKGSARLQCYDNLGKRDLIDDSVSIKTLRLVLFRPSGCSPGEKCLDWGGACRTIQSVQAVRKCSYDLDCRIIKLTACLCYPFVYFSCVPAV